jgi:hypothetical protein
MYSLIQEVFFWPTIDYQHCFAVSTERFFE